MLWKGLCEGTQRRPKGQGLNRAVHNSSLTKSRPRQIEVISWPPEEGGTLQGAWHREPEGAGTSSGPS